MPIQFFTVVVPHCSRGTVRIVGYALRKVLGWVDENGNPTREQLRFTYRELIEKAGVSRESIVKALHEAIERRCLRCIQSPQPDRAGLPAESGIYELCWDPEGHYTDRPADFHQSAAGFRNTSLKISSRMAGSSCAVDTRTLRAGAISRPSTVGA